MNREQYEATVKDIVAISQLALIIPAVEFLAAIDRSEVLAPVFDPTLFQRFMADPDARDNIDFLKEMARHIIAMKRTLIDAKAKSEARKGKPDGKAN